jgi:hypothetical protein
MFKLSARPPASDGQATSDEVGTKRKLLVLRVVVFFIMSSLAAALGAASFILLRNIELRTFQTAFDSSVNQIGTSVQTGLGFKFISYELMNNLYAYYVDNKNIIDGNKLPNVTFPGYEAIAIKINSLASLRALSFAPLVDTSIPGQRAQFEAFARKNIGTLGFDWRKVNNKTMLSNLALGIYNKTASGNKRDGNYIPGTKYPTMLFPVWQIAPINQNGGAVMHDPHSTVGSRMQTIERVIEAKSGGFTDVIQLLQDVNIRPSTILYAAITGLGPTKPIIGLFAGIFTWDQILTNTLPNYIRRVDCVLTSKTKVFTISIDRGSSRRQSRQ